MRKFWTLLAAAVVVAPVARADEAAEKVVKKAIEAHGGEKVLTAMKAAEMTMKSNMSIMGIEVDFAGEAAYAFPDKFKTTLNGEVMGQKLAIVQLVNGDKVKMTVNGMDIPVDDKMKDELKQSISTQEIGMIVPLLDKKYTLKAGKDAKVGDAEASVVTVSGKGIKEVKLFFDKKSGLLVRMQRQGLDPMGAGDVDEVTDMSDFKKVDGIQTPMTLKVMHDGKAFMTMKLSAVKYHEKLEAKRFADDQ